MAQGLRDVVGVLNGLGDYGNGRNGGEMEGKLTAKGGRMDEFEECCVVNEMRNV